ncbi:unnamed protein product [Meloidogyne enterolobii]|uniref:Uncharacterized protein n=1 Tax=Meloidogyne enterolobii TaxID=390850 RepID=A0ACB1A728_MELEN
MSSINSNSEKLEEIRENEDHKNLEDGIDIEKNNEEIKVENQEVEEDTKTNLKIRKVATKTKRNFNPCPAECIICERIASGYLFYGVICCDECSICERIAARGYLFYGVICCDGCKQFFNRCITSKNKYKCEKDGNCNLSHSKICTYICTTLLTRGMGCTISSILAV